MGVYIYTLRKRTLPIWVEGERIVANLFSYAYKDWWGFAFGEEERRRNFIRDNAARRAQEAWDSERSGYVVMGDPEYGWEDCAVYRDLQKPLWYDTDKLPATIVGYLHKIGRKWVVTPESSWQPFKRMVDGEWVPHERRFVIRDGQAHEELKPAA